MERELSLLDFLPTTRREMDLRGWDRADIILLSGDAYVDHPAFGVAMLGRRLEAEGFRVAIIPQPDWHGDLRDFRRLGRPRLWFGVAPGAMDSMVNKYTAAKRLRAEDAYSPDGRHDMRPEYPTIVYTECVRRLYPDTPVVVGGIEASMRRLMHYDYWQESFRPSILAGADADLLVYGMGEQPTMEISQRLLRALDDYDPSLGYDEEGNAYITRETFRKATIDKPVPQTAFLTSDYMPEPDDVVLHSFEEALHDPKKYAENFHRIEEESNSMRARRLVQDESARAPEPQPTLGHIVVVNPPYPPMSTEELDKSYDLPYTRLPHPKYKGKRIPAYEMIRHSVTIHRGCFGGCAFCTISAHQGKFIASRSRASILKEVEAITHMPDFKGYLSDLGGPSANMYAMKGRKTTACRACKRPSCIFPQVCPNLNVDHRPLLDLYEAVDAVKGIKKSFIGSGVRYDLLLHDNHDEALNRASRAYTRCLITRHVSGRLKVAPEHTCDHVLRLMRKPPYALFRTFARQFDDICRREGLRQQIIPYFISSHPGCREEDMARLAHTTREMGLLTDQVQDFTPTPMTVATTMWATGLNPATLEPVYVARDPEEKRRQRAYFNTKPNPNK